MLIFVCALVLYRTNVLQDTINFFSVQNDINVDINHDKLQHFWSKTIFNSASLQNCCHIDHDNLRIFALRQLSSLSQYQSDINVNPYRDNMQHFCNTTSNSVPLRKWSKLILKNHNIFVTGCWQYPLNMWN